MPHFGISLSLSEMEMKILVKAKHNHTQPGTYEVGWFNLADHLVMTVLSLEWFIYIDKEFAGPSVSMPVSE